MQLVLATRNDHKVAEFNALLEGRHEVLALPEEVQLPPETGETFAENAQGKARAASAQLQVPVIADDSGIVSRALDGRPGVYSARFAGPGATDAMNLQKLLDEAPAGSELMYVCAIAYCAPGEPEWVVHGRCHGTLAAEPRGTGGFGYDPAFVPEEHPDRTMAELSPAEKHAISHRGRAVHELLDRLG